MTNVVQDELIAATSLAQIEQSECSTLIRSAIDTTQNHLLQIAGLRYLYEMGKKVCEFGLEFHHSIPSLELSDDDTRYEIDALLIALNCQFSESPTAEPVVERFMKYQDPQLFEKCLANIAKDGLSGDDEETVNTETRGNKTTDGKLLEQALIEMKPQVDLWKSFCKANTVALEVIREREVPFSGPLFAKVLSMLKPISSDFETLGIFDTHNELVFSAFELLIQYLLANPESIFSPEDKEGSTLVLKTAVEALKDQDFETISVESGLRFLALYSKHFPEFFREYLQS